MGLELLSVALGLSSFSELVQGRQVVIHSDNAGAEWAIRKGESIMHRAGVIPTAMCRLFICALQGPRAPSTIVV